MKIGPEVDTSLGTRHRTKRRIFDLNRIIVTNFMNNWKFNKNTASLFYYKHSTTNAIHLLTSSINWSWNHQIFNKYFFNQKCTGACFIDLEKAFDSIWILGLIFKLKEYNFPFYHIILVYNMISNKLFKIFHNDEESITTFKLMNGLQQATVIFVSKWIPRYFASSDCEIGMWS